MQRAPTSRPAVFVQTNDDDNHVIAFARAPDGTLGERRTYATGGRGDGRAHLTSQGSVALTGDGRHLLVTNAGSDDVSAFDVTGDVTLVARTPTRGTAPKSVAEHEGLVYVLNTGSPSLVGFRLGEDGFEPIVGSERRLPQDADPPPAGFAPHGRSLVVTERGADRIASFPVRADGLLGDPDVVASSGPTPYGFAFAGPDVLVVTEAFRAEKGRAAASSYANRESRLESVSSSVGNGRSEICWAVATPDGRFAFTTNFADGAVSRYRVEADGALVLED